MAKSSPLTSAKWTRIFDAINHLTMVIDRENNIIHANKATLNALGLTQEQISQRKCYELFHGAEAPPEKCPMRKLLQQGENPQTVTQDVEALGGQYIVSCSPILDRQGNIELAVHGAFEITHRRQMEQALRELSLRQESILATVPEIIMEVDENKIYTWANQAGLEFFGPDVIGRQAADFFEGEQETYRTVQPLFNGHDDVIYLESWQRRQDGRKRLLAWWCRVLKNSAGQVVGALSTARDITEQNAAGQALKESEEKFALAFKTSPYAITITHPNDGKFIEVNEAFATITGFTREEALNSASIGMGLWANMEDRTQVVKELLAGGRVIGREFLFKKKNGEIITGLFSADVFRIKDNTYILSSINDISERKQLEEQLRQSQKMEAVGRLAGGIAHDFNNILTAIQGFGDMALDKIAPDDPLRPDVQEILNAADSAASLTRQLLTFSRKQIVDPRVIDLNLILARSERMLRRIIGEDIELQFKPSADLWSVRVDPVQLDQVLINLAVNARDAMPETGKLIIETANVNLDVINCPVCGSEFSGEFAMLAISDTGCGIRPELLGQIFEPFFTTKDTGKGTGLGLPTVQGIVHQAGGHVTVYSEPGLGATFKLYFPRVNATPDRVVAQQPAIDMSGRETILLVEDQEQVRRLACRALRSKGYNVIEAALPSQALLLAQGHKGPIDLLLTDVIMPEMNGKQLYQHLLEIRPGQPVLFMSGYTENAIAHHGVLEPGINFLQKPFRPDDLLLAVRRTLNAPTPVSNKPIEIKGSDVLLIEDEDNVRLIMRLMLEREGCRVLEASSGQAGLKLYSEQPAAPALVLLDLGLPDLPGEQVLEQMLAQHADQRVLLMSGYGYNELPAGLLDRPTVSFIQKPFKREPLVEAIKELLKN